MKRSPSYKNKAEEEKKTKPLIHDNLVTEMLMMLVQSRYFQWPGAHDYPIIGPNFLSLPQKTGVSH